MSGSDCPTVVSILPINQCDVHSPPERKGGGHQQLLVRTDPSNRAPSPLEYNLDGRRKLTDSTPGHNLTPGHVSELWSRTLRALFINSMSNVGYLDLADQIEKNAKFNVTVVQNSVDQLRALFLAPKKPSPKLIIKRGHIFRINLHFNRYFNQRTDKVTLILKEEKCGRDKSIELECVVGFTDAKTGWKVETVGMKSSKATIFLKVPESCAYGTWLIEVATSYSLSSLID